MGTHELIGHPEEILRRGVACRGLASSPVGVAILLVGSEISSGSVGQLGPSAALLYNAILQQGCRKLRLNQNVDQKARITYHVHNGFQCTLVSIDTCTVPPPDSRSFHHFGMGYLCTLQPLRKKDIEAIC